MFAVTGGSCYPSRGGKFTGRMKNPRMGSANNIEKWDEGYLKRRNKRLESLNDAERDMWINSMDRGPHPWNPWNMLPHSWMGIIHGSRATDNVKHGKRILENYAQYLPISMG